MKITAIQSKQSGATLVVALILLAIVTVLGVAGMRGTNLEMRMIASARDRAMAFEAAEATLRAVEQTLITAPPSLADINTIYDAECTGGQCFQGFYDPLDPYASCLVFQENDKDVKQLWADEDEWTEGNGKYGVQTVSVFAENGSATPKTIETKFKVEFMCFTLKDQGLKAKVDDREAGDDKLIFIPLFRVTALAEGYGQRARVMAQSTVRVNL
jgi:type IV pilus assembly protein PilX